MLSKEEQNIMVLGCDFSGNVVSKEKQQELWDKHKSDQSRYHFLAEEQCQEKINAALRILNTLRLDFKEIRHHWAYKTIKQILESETYLKEFPSGVPTVGVTVYSRETVEETQEETEKNN